MKTAREPVGRGEEPAEGKGVERQWLKDSKCRFQLPTAAVAATLEHFRTTAQENLNVLAQMLGRCLRQWTCQSM